MDIPAILCPVKGAELKPWIEWNLLQWKCTESFGVQKLLHRIPKCEQIMLTLNVRITMQFHK